MIKVLVVEDDADKLRRILLCLHEVPSCEPGMIQNARDAISAKRLMRQEQFDLVILDIALPESPDDLPALKTGIALFTEVIERTDTYYVPHHFVGLTAYDDALTTALPLFTNDLWTVIEYDNSSTDWQCKLQRKLRHVLIAKRTPEVFPDFQNHLCVVTALQSPELKAVLRIPWQWTRLEIPTDNTIYHRGQYEKDGKTYRIVAATAPSIGMTATAVLAVKMITQFHPRYVAMAGITAGIKGISELGDVIAADPSWDWGSGKFRISNDEVVFEPAPNQIPLDARLRSRLSLFSQDHAALDQIRSEWSGAPPTHPLRLHLGPVASGAAVLADSSTAQSIRQQHRKIIGIEMETYGLFAAVAESPLPQPMAFSLKSVCDWADSSKADDSQEYAAYTSAAALKCFVEAYL